ncbi:MAG: Cytochrome b561 [Holosporales bacterium]
MIQSYTLAQKQMHWLMAVIFIFMLTMGFFMEDLPHGIQPTVYMMHKSFGVLVLMLIPIRLILRLITPPNPVHEAKNLCHKLLIKMSVPILYLMMFVIAFSGFLMVLKAGRGIDVFNIFSIHPFLETDMLISKTAKFVHKKGVVIAAFIVSAHIISAFYHHFVIKDHSLKSMLRSK